MFKAYLENDLMPYLSSDFILIMDNMKSHHAKAVKALLDNSHVQCVYLPPYSSDLNPIEKLWSKIKALLRKFKARTEWCVATFILPEFVNYVSLFLRNLLYLILLVDIYTTEYGAYQHFTVVLNDGGKDAQSERAKYAI